MKVSVCIDAVFQGKDFVKSLNEIASIGVRAFEFWSWWDKDFTLIQKEKDRLGLEVVAFCTKFFSLVDTRQREAYINGLKESIEVAKQLGCNKLITQVGNDLGISREVQKNNLIEGLKRCAPILEAEDITLVFEPLNTLVDHAGYFLYDSEEAFDIAKAVGSPKVKVLYDIYHQQIMEGNIISTISSNIDQIGHFHAAGNPGRHELEIGEINYKEIFRSIDALSYPDYVGFEYFPIEEPLSGIREYI